MLYYCPLCKIESDNSTYCAICDNLLADFYKPLEIRLFNSLLTSKDRLSEVKFSGAFPLENKMWNVTFLLIENNYTIPLTVLLKSGEKMKFSQNYGALMKGNKDGQNNFLEIDCVKFYEIHHDLIKIGYTYPI